MPENAKTLTVRLENVDHILTWGQERISWRKHVAKHLLHSNEAWHELDSRLSHPKILEDAIRAHRVLGQRVHAKPIGSIPTLELQLKLAPVLDPYLEIFRDVAFDAVLRSARFPALVVCGPTETYASRTLRFVDARGLTIIARVDPLHPDRLAVTTCFRAGREGNSAFTRALLAVRKAIDQPSIERMVTDEGLFAVLEDIDG